MLKISNSRLNTFRKCHYSHYLKYVLKLVKKAKEEPLQRGSIIHECIEAYNNGKSWIKPFNKFRDEFYKTTFAEERVEIGDLPKMVKELLENYFYFYEDEELEYVQNELHFTLPLTKEIEIEGYVDAVVKDARGKTWPMETKTYARTPDRDFLVFNNQSAIYTWALKELSFKPEGTLWNILKAKEPSRPKMTEKTKKLSLAKLDSTPYTVEKGIIELGLNPKDYREFIDGHDYESFFFRHYIRLNDNVVKLIMDDTKSTANEILHNGEKLKDRNLSKDCSWCSYRSICQAELMGLDTDYIIKTEYQLKEEGGRKVEKAKESTTTKKGRNRK
jgi:hypothetical protein